MRFRYIGPLLILVLLATAIMAAPASAQEQSLQQLKTKLQQTKHRRQRAHAKLRAALLNLAGARELYAATNPPADGATVPDPTAIPTAVPAGMSPALAAALLADGVVTAEEVAAMQSRVTKHKRLVHRWTLKVRRLKKAIRRLVQIAKWNRRGNWKPLIKIACRKYHVSAAGLYRMMMLESSGRRFAGTMFKGLFQYLPSTWAGNWNPWRRESIFNGWAQIRATAYAISRGMGPSQWPNTYPMAF